MNKVMNNSNKSLSIVFAGATVFFSSACLMAIEIALALPWTVITGKHVSVTLVIGRMSNRTQVKVKTVIELLGAVLFWLMAWQAFNQTMYSYRSLEVMGAVDLYLYPFKGIFFIGCFLTAVAFSARFVMLILKSELVILESELTEL